MNDFIILPTSYCPSIGYFYMLTQYKKVKIEQFETYLKQTCRNRTMILTENGPFRLSVPVHKPKGSHTKTNEVEVCYKQDWNKKHWRAIESAYNNAPFFLYYKDELKTVLHHRYTYLLELNNALMQFFLKKLNLQLNWEYTSSFILKDEPYDDSSFMFGEHREIIMPPYYQVFSDRYTFVPNLSVMDILFNLGKNAHFYIMELKYNKII